MDWESSPGASVSWEWGTATLRASRFRPEEVCGKPPFCAVASVTRITDDAVKISALCGDVEPRHFALFAAHLAKRGIRWAYAERLGGHTVPFAERVEGGPFDGWWLLDVSKIQRRAKK